MMEFSNFLNLARSSIALRLFLSAAAFPPQLKFCNKELLEPMKLLLFSPPKVYF